MASTSIKTSPSGDQTTPASASNRLSNTAIRIEPCTPNDAEKIAEGLYACFPSDFWDRKEPPALRPDDNTRVQRLATRIRPSFSSPHMHWMKAVSESGETMGVAGWIGPGNPVHSFFRRSAVDFYGWRAQTGWSDAELDEMWAHVSDEMWNGTFAHYDEVRLEVLGTEPHWYLSTLLTWPEFQKRGVGSKLLKWAIDLADGEVPPTPLYLESAPTARAVYMRAGFVPIGEMNFVRRGPREEGQQERAKAEPVAV